MKHEMEEISLFWWDGMKQWECKDPLEEVVHSLYFPRIAQRDDQFGKNLVFLLTQEASHRGVSLLCVFGVIAEMSAYGARASRRKERRGEHRGAHSKASWYTNHQQGQQARASPRGYPHVDRASPAPHRSAAPALARRP